MSKNYCAIVESRHIPNIRKIVENHVYYSGFKPIFFHGAYNEDFIKQELSGIDCDFVNLGINELSASGYNRLLTSRFFWDKIPSEQVLIFQHDSWMLRKGLEEFYPYSMIGSPLYHISMPAMNGGISLRHKSKMLEVIEKIPYNDGVNEDVWFCLGIEKIGGVLPTRDIAMKFGVETMATLGSLCYHAIGKYLSEEICQTIKNQYKNDYSRTL